MHDDALNESEPLGNVREGAAGRSTLCQFLLALIDLNTFVTAKSIC